jgi:hypothetical protein
MSTAKKTKNTDLKTAGLTIQNNYYKTKLKQQSNRIKILEKEIKKIEPIENKKLSFIIMKLQKHVNEFIKYVKKNPNPVKIMKYSLIGERPMYLGLFGIIVYSVYLIIKQITKSS